MVRSLGLEKQTQQHELPDLPKYLRQTLDDLNNSLRDLINDFGGEVDLFRAAIILTSPDGYMLGIAFVNISTTRIEKLHYFAAQLFTHPKPPKGVAGHSATRMKTIILPDLRKDAGPFIDFRGSSGRRNKGILCVPILDWVSGPIKCLAVVSITSTKPNVFTEWHQEQAELFAKNIYRPVLSCYSAHLDLINKKGYNSTPITERDINPPIPVEEQQIDQFQQAALKIIEELRSNWRIPAHEHPTKFERVLTTFLNNPTGLVSFDELSSLFDDAKDVEHTRDVFIGRLNAKLEEHGYRIERPRAYHLVSTTSPPDSKET